MLSPAGEPVQGAPGYPMGNASDFFIPGGLVAAGFGFRGDDIT
jgi:hypothetical protein